MREGLQWRDDSRMPFARCRDAALSGGNAWFIQTMCKMHAKRGSKHAKMGMVVAVALWGASVRAIEKANEKWERVCGICAAPQQDLNVSCLWM